LCNSGFGFPDLIGRRLTIVAGAMIDSPNEFVMAFGGIPIGGFTGQGCNQ